MREVNGVSSPERKDDDPRASMTLVVAIFGAILVVVVIIFLQAFFFGSQDTEQQAKSFVPAEELMQVRASQLDRIGSYRWVDARQGVAAIPVDRAMELVVRDQGRDPALPELVTPGAGAVTPPGVTPAGTTPAAGATGTPGTTGAAGAAGK